MDLDIPVRQPPLTDQVYELLLKEILIGKFQAGALLPSENQLAETYNVSRPTIRAAFTRLLDRGYVVRHRGIGTFVAERPNITDPLYRLLDIQERISTRGYTPGFQQIKTELIKADDFLARVLEVPKDSPILNIHKVYTADGKPIVLFINYIPEWVYVASQSIHQVLEPGATEPFFEFFADRCGRKVSYLASTIKPEIASKVTLPDEFVLEDACSPLLVIEDIGYGQGDIPLFLSYEHLFGDASTFHIVRYVDNI
jgi:GntR family transcriptional regulator